MSIWKSTKEAITVVVCLPLAFISATAATIVLALQWVGASAIERLPRWS